MALPLIDISRHQGDIDWPRLAPAISGVVIRATMGATGVDPLYREYWRESGWAGVQKRGIYHLVITNVPAVQQRENILRTTGGDFGTEPIALDCERTAADRALAVFPKARYTDMLFELVTLMRREWPVRGYSSAEEWKLITTLPAWAEGFLDWLAHYNDQISSPALPPGVATWKRWQYTSKGRRPGIAGDVDLNQDAVAPAPPEVEQPAMIDTGKLCPHIIAGSGDAERMRCPVYLLVDGWGQAERFARLPHAPLVLGRHTVAGEVRPDFLSESGADPLSHAQAYYAAEIRPHVLANPHVAAWLGPNEPVAKTPDAMAWYALFEAERVRLLALDGKRAVVGNFSAGQPEPELWPHFAPALDAIRAHRGFLGLHEYGEPVCGPWDTWFMGRLTRAPLDVPVVITECGTDSIPPTDTLPAGQPWRGQFGGDVAAYADFLAGYRRHLEAYPNVVGACIFTFGSLWPEHNVEGAGLVERLERDMYTVQVTVADGLSLGDLRGRIGATNIVDMRLVVPVENVPPPPPPKHTMSTLTNQQVINLFAGTFGGLSVLGRAIPNWATALAGSTAIRNALYTGPAIEDMPITDAEKSALIARL